jgi:hypothetical protein
MIVSFPFSRTLISYLIHISISQFGVLTVKTVGIRAPFARRASWQSAEVVAGATVPNTEIAFSGSGARAESPQL